MPDEQLYWTLRALAKQLLRTHGSAIADVFFVAAYVVCDILVAAEMVEHEQLRIA